MGIIVQDSPVGHPVIPDVVAMWCRAIFDCVVLGTNEMSSGLSVILSQTADCFEVSTSFIIDI